MVIDPTPNLFLHTPSSTSIGFLARPLREMFPTVASSLQTFAAMSGRRASGQNDRGKRAAAQPLASPGPVVAPVVSAPPRPGLQRDANQLVAWKSVQHERWEGALQVEGKLPLWLVGDPIHYTMSCNYMHMSFFPPFVFCRPASSRVIIS
jgi:hypothetical protein